MVAIVCAVGALAAVYLALGIRARVATVLLAWVGAGVAASGLERVHGLAIALAVLFFAALPSAPFGSWPARGRLDPDGGWRFPPGLRVLAWLALAAGALDLGLARLADAGARPDGAAARALVQAALAVELALAPLALVARARPWIWSASLAVHAALLATLEPDAAIAGLLLLHVLTFEPGRIRPRRGAAPARVYYDGTCGLCHRGVRLLLAEDPDGTAFRFAPLTGPSFEREVSAAERAGLPDSLVLRGEDGALLARSDAVGRMLQRLGGLWRVLGTTLLAVPRPLRDALYDRVAAVRRRLFAAPEAACPLVPPHLAGRFDP